MIVKSRRLKFLAASLNVNVTEATSPNAGYLSPTRMLVVDYFRKLPAASIGVGGSTAHLKSPQWPDGPPCDVLMRSGEPHVVPGPRATPVFPGRSHTGTIIVFRGPSAR